MDATTATQKEKTEMHCLSKLANPDDQMHMGDWMPEHQVAKKLIALCFHMHSGVVLRWMLERMWLMQKVCGACGF